MSEQIVFTSPGGWLEVIETPNKFYYARRKGRDSVAVFLVDKEQNKVLIRWQPLPRDNADKGQIQQLFACPITGSISENETPLKTAIREVEEESGYKNVELTFIFDYLVGTQSDELVHVYYGFVDSNVITEGLQDGTYFESISKNVWEPFENLRTYNYAACRLFYFKQCI